MSEYKDDRFMKDILKNGFGELNDPDFVAATMKKVLREHRRRRFVDSIIRNALVFVAVDSIIYLLLKVTGMTIAELTGVVVNLLNRVLFRAGELKPFVPGNNATVYLVLFFVGIVIVLTFIELGLDSWGGHKRRTTW